MGIFGGLVLLLVIILVGYGFSLAITYWFISIPLLALWLYMEVKRDQRRRAMPRTPEQQAADARAQADIDRFNAKEAMYRKIAKDERDRVRGR